MCYSKEVSLVVGATLAVSVAWAWRSYVVPSRVVSLAGGVVQKDAAALEDRGPDRSAMEPGTGRSALGHVFAPVLLGHLCIAGHQALEFLAITTESQWVYKAGLVMSMSCMIFLMQALERLTSASYGSRVLTLGVVAVGAELALRPASFENQHFWVRGHGHGLWGAVWMTMFFYWVACIVYAARRTASAANRRLMYRFPWAVLGFTFVLAMAYTFLAALAKDVPVVARLWNCVGSDGIAASHDIVKDAPSIWCVFAVAQVLLLPGWMRAMNEGYDAGSAPVCSGSHGKHCMALLAVALVATAAMYASYPIVNAVCAKMVTH